MVRVAPSLEKVAYILIPTVKIHENFSVGSVFDGESNKNFKKGCSFR